MAVTEEARCKSGAYEPVTWNFKLLAHHDARTASAAWAKACRCRSRPTAAASSGSRTRARRRTSPRSTSPIRASRRWWCRPTCRRATCARTRWRPAATSWRSPTRPRRRAMKPAGFELFDISDAGEAEVDRVLRLLGPSIRAACTSSGSATANTSTWRRARPTSCRRIRSTTSSTAASTCAIRRSRSRSAAGGCPAPSRATTCRRRRATAARQGLPRAQHQRLSAAAGPLLSRLHRRRHVRPRHLRQGEPEADLVAGTNSPPYTGFTHTVVPLFDRGLMLVTDESTENNAKDWPKLVWILDARDETNLVPIATCPLPDHKAYAARAAASAPTTSTRTCRCRPAGSPTRSCSAPSSTAACAPTTSPTRTSRKEVGDLRAAGAGAGADRHDPAQRRVRRRARDRLHGRPPRRRAVLLEMDF